MENLKHMKEMLVYSVQSQLSHLEDVNTCELGEVIDMIKDLEEAMYYCAKTRALLADEEDEEGEIYRHHEAVHHHKMMPASAPILPNEVHKA